MATPANEAAFSHPDFVEGELALGVAPVMSTAAFTTRYLARRFDFLPGRYSVRAIVDDAATFWVGTDQKSMRMIESLYGVENDGVRNVIEFEFELYPGETRFDIYLHNLSPAASASYVMFSIYRGGRHLYASSAADWNYRNDHPLADSEVDGDADTRRNHPVFSLLPNWSNGIMERLEYLTDILSGERSIEQRRSLRLLPRRSIEVSFLRNRANRARLSNLLAGLGSRPFLLPLWFEQFYVTEPLLASASTFTFPAESLHKREFRAGGLVFITNKDPNVFDVAIIDEVDLETDTITWEINPTRNWPVGTRIIPLQMARMIETPSLNNPTDGVGQVTVRFELIDPDPGFGSSWGYCAPLFRLKPNRVDPVVHIFNRDLYTLENDLATPFIVDPSDQSLVGERASFVLRGRDMTYYFRRFVSMARGRAVRFYVPSFTNDVVPIEDIPPGRTYFDAYPGNFSELTRTPQRSRRLLGFYFNDTAAPIYREVLSVDPVSEVGPPYISQAERFNLATPVPPMTMSRISRISWIQAVRFDQDGFELQHEVDDSAVVKTALVFRTADPTGMPPIECWVTSKPYPLQVIESMASSIDFPDARFQPSLIEEMASHVDDFTAILKDVILGYDNYIPESMESEIEFVDGEMITVAFLSYDNYPPESMESDIEFVDGSMEISVVFYDRYVPESVSSSVEFIEGTMS